MTQPVSDFSAETLNDLSDYFHGAPIGLKVTGPDGTISRTNLAELKMLGYDDHADEYVGRHLAEFHSDPEALQVLLDRLVAGEKITEHETTLVRRDGTPQRVLLYASARIDSGGFRGARCFTFPHPEDLRPDIAEVGALTDQSVASRGLDISAEQQTELYSELLDFFENAPVSLHIVGGDGLIKHANKSELDAMGYEREAYIGQHIARFHADQKVIDGMLEDLVGGTPLVNFGATLFRKDGSKLPVMIYSNSRMREGSFVNTRCFTVSVPKARRAAADQSMEFSWPRNEDFGFTIPERKAPTARANPMTLALKYIASRKRPEESLGFLAHVSQVLSTSRPFDAMLAEVLSATVPFLADLACVETASGIFAHAAAGTLRARTETIARHLAAGPVETRLDLHGMRDASDERASELVRMGVRSLIAAPLSVRGARVGELTLLREDAPARRPFGPADRALADELARRISFAIEIERLSARA